MGTVSAECVLAAMISNTVYEVKTTLARMNFRQFITQGVNLALIVFSALMIWKGLMVVTGSESPVVVVLSGSMEPAFQRGDILFLYMGTAPVRVGEILVFKVDDDGKGDYDLLTKGDNNRVDDRGLYSNGQ